MTPVVIISLFSTSIGIGTSFAKMGCVNFCKRGLPQNQETILPNRADLSQTEGTLSESKSFVPKGAVAFLVAMLAVYAGVWFFFFKLMVTRNG